jgi:hypothetical protein
MAQMIEYFPHKYKALSSNLRTSKKKELVTEMYYLRFCPLEWITEKSANNITTVAGGLRQRLRGHQSFREASLLTKVVETADSCPKAEP